MTNVSMTVNGKSVSRDVPDTTLLSDFLREHLRLTGTHVGCDTSQCGACVVHVDGRAVKSCTALAVSLDGAEVTTIEGLAQGGEMHPMQAAFNKHHGLQCGFCTPGMIMAGIDMVNRYQAEGRTLTQAIRHELEGNICRCTGYHNIVNAIEDAAGQMAGHVQGRGIREDTENERRYRRPRGAQGRQAVPHRQGQVHRRHPGREPGLCRLRPQPGGACEAQRHRRLGGAGDGGRDRRPSPAPR
jgi:carbon-monoxide dehydrogenase small subunit